MGKKSKKCEVPVSLAIVQNCLRSKGSIELREEVMPQGYETVIRVAERRANGGRRVNARIRCEEKIEGICFVSCTIRNYCNNVCNTTFMGRAKSISILFDFFCI